MDSNTSYHSNLLKARSRDLVMTASIEGSKHLQDGTIKTKLIHSYSNIGSTIVSDFESNRKSFHDSMMSIDNEINDIRKQSLAIYDKYNDPIKKGIGLAAGIIQMIGGGVGVYMTCGTSIFSDLMFLNGLNNTYENGIYFITGDTDAEGFMRSLYQIFAHYLGESSDKAKFVGSFMYGVTDLVLSGVGLISLSKDVKLINAGIFSGFKKFTLFHAFNEELLRGYQSIGVPALLWESYSDFNTISNAQKDYNSLRGLEGKPKVTMDSLLKDIVKKSQTQGAL